MDRRAFLSWVQGGLAGAASMALLLRDGTLRAGVQGEARPPCPHFAPKATRALHICLCGAMSQVDTFDFKPGLIAAHVNPSTRQPSPTRSSARSAGCAGPTGGFASGVNPASGSPTCFHILARWPTS
jgi:hypothetical protein